MRPIQNVVRLPPDHPAGLYRTFDARFISCGPRGPREIKSFGGGFLFPRQLLHAVGVPHPLGGGLGPLTEQTVGPLAVPLVDLAAEDRQFPWSLHRHADGAALLKHLHDDVVADGEVFAGF